MPRPAAQPVPSNSSVAFVTYIENPAKIKLFLLGVDFFKGVVLEHNFGREFQENENLKNYKLIIHCGGCMISSQKLLARIQELEALGIRFTNYGLFLAYIQGENALKRVIEPWNLY